MNAAMFNEWDNEWWNEMDEEKINKWSWHGKTIICMYFRNKYSKLFCKNEASQREQILSPESTFWRR
jgi:hypothetical protein